MSQVDNAAIELKYELSIYANTIIQDTIEDYLAGLAHDHTCQQCGKIIRTYCECDNPTQMNWCSANCRAAFDFVRT